MPAVPDMAAPPRPRRPARPAPGRGRSGARRAEREQVRRRRRPTADIERATPSSDLFALGAARQIGHALEPAWQDGADAAARRAVMLGALHAGIAFGNASVALVHGMSRPIGAYFHVPHGIANAMLLPVVLRYSLPAAPERYRDLAATLGLPVAGHSAEAAGAAFADWVASLAWRLEVPSLTGYGLDPAEVRRVAPQMAADALASGSPGNNPRIPTRRRSSPSTSRPFDEWAAGSRQ